MADTQFWDRVARRYAARPIGNMAAYETTLARARAWLREEDRVLELGCGTGSTALLLAPDVGHLIASDLSGGMIAVADEKLADFEGDNLEFRQSDAFDESFGPGSFDAVLAFNFLHLLDDMNPTLARVQALLKPGGLFISKTICLGRHAWHFRALIGVMRLLGKAPPFLQFIGPEDVQGAMRAAGFVIEETGDYPARPRAHFIVARKPADAAAS